MIDLFKEGLIARSYAYVKYSNFRVGAVLLFKNGDIVRGCNVENASYGLSNCAERSAIFSAISQGYDMNDCVEMLIVGDTKLPISPCGACRQVMSEFLKKDTKITLTNLTNVSKVMTVEELIPYSFSDKDLNL
ncbi:MAG: cytidine deaminase [Acholeplasmatales bacterium]|nr:cytidine deaminase [Acholeplasmatales bacterium]